MIEAAFHEKGPPYVRWAAKMAVDLRTGVPWVMCKQDDAPDPVVSLLLKEYYLDRFNKLKTFQLASFNCCICLFRIFFGLLTNRLLLQINTCNGRRCGETFAGPNSPNKPAIWTENWTSLYALNTGFIFLLTFLSLL